MDTIEVKKIVEHLLNLLGLKGEVEVVVGEGEEPTVVTINTEETGILIGRHGETISALETILNQIINRDKQEWQRIVVDTGDYRAKQEDRLKNLALEAASRVKETGEPYSLYDLTPAQRRIVHTILAEDQELLTESEGEGRERRLVVRLRD